MCRWATACCVFALVVYTIILVILIADYEMKTRYRAHYNGFDGIENSSEPNIFDTLIGYGQTVCENAHICHVIDRYQFGGSQEDSEVQQSANVYGVRHPMYRGDHTNNGQILTPKSNSNRSGDHVNNVSVVKDLNNNNNEQSSPQHHPTTPIGPQDAKWQGSLTPSTGPIVHRNRYYNAQQSNGRDSGGHGSQHHHNRSPYAAQPGGEHGKSRQLSSPVTPVSDPSTIIKKLFADKGISLDHSVKLGSGRYSKVITAQTYSGATIAIKMINKNKVTTDFRDKFLPRELECWKMLEHQNIVRLCSHYESKLIGYVFLVMEYGSGGDMLSHVQGNGPVPELQAQRWVFEICSAMAYMHGRDIAHRDLKLENIVIFGKSVKIADFGFSRQVKNEFSHTFCGSKSYSAPEILLGQAYNAFKADVWSVGVVAFVMCTDTMPYRENMSNHKIVDVQKNRQYRFPRNVPISAECKAIIDHILNFEPHQRCTMAELLTLPWIVAGKELAKPEGKSYYFPSPDTPRSHPSPKHPPTPQKHTPAKQNQHPMMQAKHTPQAPIYHFDIRREEAYKTYYGGVRDDNNNNNIHQSNQLTKTRPPTCNNNAPIDDQRY